MGTRVSLYYSNGFEAHRVNDGTLIAIEFPNSLNPVVVIRMPRGDELRLSLSAISKIEHHRDENARRTVRGRDGAYGRQ
jgi:hypothetical protein